MAQAFGLGPRLRLVAGLWAMERGETSSSSSALEDPQSSAASCPVAMAYPSLMAPGPVPVVHHVLVESVENQLPERPVISSSMTCRVSLAIRQTFAAVHLLFKLLTTAITAASSVIGPIIPPSGIMIIYAYVMGESVAALFLAGIIPGILVGIGLMFMVRVLADRYDLPKAERVINKNQSLSNTEYWLSYIILRINLAMLLSALLTLFSSISVALINQPIFLNTWTIALLTLPFVHFFLLNLRKKVSKDFRYVCKRAVVPLQTPIIILGGILLGVFTPTEAASIAVAYAFIISFFVLKTIKLKDLPAILTKAALGSSAVLLLIGGAMAFKVVVSLSHAPEQLATFVLSLSENPLILLFLM